MHKLRAYMQLVRLPAVFTAMADIFLGFLLARRELQPALGFGMLLLASSCLYLAGMVFNDLFDREVDARRRPERPIPSGRVSVTAAARLGILLVLAGLGAAQVAGSQSLLVAGVLTLLVFAYDGYLKRTPFGPVGMGLCRFLNVLLGASLLDPAAGVGMSLSLTGLRLPVLAQPQLHVAAALGIYVAGVTWLARYEAGGNTEKGGVRRGPLAGAVAVVDLGLAGLIVFVTGIPGLLLPWPGEAAAAGVLFALALIALVLNRRMAVALLHPVPERIQPAVRTLLLSIIVLDATVVFYHTASTFYALATVALVAPALLLGRWVFVT